MRIWYKCITDRSRDFCGLPDMCHLFRFGCGPSWTNHEMSSNVDKAEIRTILNLTGRCNSNKTADTSTAPIKTTKWSARLENQCFQNQKSWIQYENVDFDVRVRQKHYFWQVFHQIGRHGSKIDFWISLTKNNNLQTKNLILTPASVKNLIVGSFFLCFFRRALYTGGRWLNSH